MRNDNPDQPPDGAVPLAIARRTLCGDTRMVQTFDALERQLAEVLPDIVAGDRRAMRWSGPIRRDLITTREWIDQKLLRRLRSGELVAWGRSEPAGWRWVRLPTWLWDRIAVLDWELGEVGREMRPEPRPTPITRCGSYRATSRQRPVLPIRQRRYQPRRGLSALSAWRNVSRPGC